MKNTVRMTSAALAVALTTTLLSPMAFADAASDQKSKNDWRNIAIGAGTAALYGLNKHDSTVTVLGAAGAAYAAKKYEDQRKQQSQAAANRARFHHTTSNSLGTGGTSSRYLSNTSTTNSTVTSTTSANGGIQVDVNGSPVQFSGQQPIESNGAVLVPLRGVFEAMGANVDYNAANRTILANKGNRSVLLPLGSMTAQVNGNTTHLTQPARVIYGTTLVPLRFVAESLGSYVEWVSARNTVEIRTNGADTAVAEQPVQEPVSAPLAHGTVASIGALNNGNSVIVLRNGRSIELASDTVIRRNGRDVSASSIHAGDQISFHTEDGSRIATRVILGRPYVAHQNQ